MSVKSETDINVPLDEPLTSDSCTKLVVEFVKYLLYQKQQIPFTYESLTQLQGRMKPTDRNFSSIKSVVNSVKSVSDQLFSQFLLEGCRIREIVVIIGATIISPKFYVRLELPTEILDSGEHVEHQHSSRKALLSLMRSMLECGEFQEAMTLPLCPTNTFVMLLKSDPRTASEFFLPKQRYSLPVQSMSCFRFRLYHSSKVKTECSCGSLVKVYRELGESRVLKDNENSEGCDSDENAQTPFLWYQSKEVIKGFKFCR